MKILILIIIAFVAAGIIYGYLPERKARRERLQKIIDMYKALGFTEMPNMDEVNMAKVRFFDMNLSDYKQCDEFVEKLDALEDLRKEIMFYNFRYCRPQGRSEKEEHEFAEEISRNYAMNVACSFIASIKDDISIEDPRFIYEVRELAESHDYKDKEEQKSVINRYNLLKERMENYNRIKKENAVDQMLDRAMKD